jgi:hypothetical protein
VVPGIDSDGQEIATVTVKGTFVLPQGTSSEPLQVHECQAAIAMADVPFGEPADKTSIRYAAESCPTKTGTDVALIGHAYPAPGSDSVVDVGLRVGPLTKVVRVFGDRTWSRGVGRARPSPPRRFSKMPLVFERAFGGWDTASSDPKEHDFEPRNPVGVGFAASRASNPAGMPLPNLEDPRLLIAAQADRPAPACFGFIAPSWLPRRARAGTYDDRWQQERCPMLPLDFNPEFFQSSPVDLVVRGHLKGGERVAVSNATPAGELAFTVPRRTLEIGVWIRGELAIHRSVMDTLVIEPDEQRVLCTWKTTFACSRKFLYIDLIRIREVAP